MSMNLPSTYLNPTTANPSSLKFSGLSPTRIFSKNVGTHLKNAFNYVAQDHGSLRSEVFVYSALLLVTTRSAVTNAMAARAIGTENEEHRRLQAIRTTFRQLAGWAASYLLLRKIQYSFRKRLRKAFGVVHKADDMRREATSWRQNIVEDFWKWWNNPKKLKLAKANSPLYLGVKENIVFSEESRLYKNKAVRFLIDKVFSHPRLLKDSERELFTLAGKRVNRFINWSSLIVSSVPTVIISGLALEYFNQNYSDRLFGSINHYVQKISHYFGKSNPEAAEPIAKNSITVSSRSIKTPAIPTPWQFTSNSPDQTNFSTPQNTLKTESFPSLPNSLSPFGAPQLNPYSPYASFQPQ